MGPPPVSNHSVEVALPGGFRLCTPSSREVLVLGSSSWLFNSLGLHSSIAIDLHVAGPLLLCGLGLA